MGDHCLRYRHSCRRGLGRNMDGAYEFNSRTNEIDMELSVVFPPQVFSTGTGQASAHGHRETYSFALPNDFGREVPIELTIQGRPLAVRFRKIRDFPQWQKARRG